ncbi:hypothetical protein JDV02_010494 [Purpureocillium takamizusanense]|uniref:Uncharacterized protein n=1 Tax=Purpureocillium takamizusanense TaxID=2060973 RepID=A0A9Q8VF91_9HYPO|nr:uncharacterized protein JDV02_010494 [Purpureocillium takamizusanense]UNI24770.1 hypothetical protein JDV02_010494 [Purpureocillium takamizusanense]
MCEQREEYEQCPDCHRKRLLRRIPEPCVALLSKHGNNWERHFGECSTGVQLTQSIEMLEQGCRKCTPQQTAMKRRRRA